MPETKQAAAPVESPASNNGTPADKQSDTNTPPENATPPAKGRELLSKGWFKKLIPVAVLALAAIIFFGISGGWTRWVGSGSQKTDDAIL